MLRRKSTSAAYGLAIAAFLAGVSSITSKAAIAGERDDYKKLVLYDVKGDATIIKFFPYFLKREGLNFKYGTIYIDKLRCWFYGSCYVEGKITGKIFDDYWQFVTFVYPTYFKAQAWLYKEDDYGSYTGATAAKYPHKPPKDCDLEIDIGKIKVEQFDRKDFYKKFPTLIFIDPDRQDLYVRDDYYRQKLCEVAKSSYESAPYGPAAVE